MEGIDERAHTNGGSKKKKRMINVSRTSLNRMHMIAF